MKTKSDQIQASIRFYAELNDFLASKHRQKTFSVTFPGHTSVKHLIESLGIPHTEVDLILVNGTSVGFSHIPSDQDHISVYPVFESIDIGPVNRLRPAPLRQPKFILDAHLGKLAIFLRMLGFDVLYRNDFEDEEIAGCSSSEKRIVLTRDRGLLKRCEVTHGYYIRNTDPKKQVVEVVQRFDLKALAKPLTRCLECNHILEKTDKNSVYNAIPHNTREWYDDFHICPACKRIYWKGSHYEKMKKFIEEILS